MGKVEEVAKKLAEFDHYKWDELGIGAQGDYEYLAGEICQLFEPKPDESRLLTNDEMIDVFHQVSHLAKDDEDFVGCYKCAEVIAKAQDAKMASIENVWSLHKQMGWGPCRLSRALNIPYTTIWKILRKKRLEVKSGKSNIEQTVAPRIT